MKTLVREQNCETVDFRHDRLHRLTEEKITDAVNGNKTIGFVMDAVGNRTSKTDSVGGTTTYVYDANDRLLTETINGQTKTYTYDAKGNTIGESKAANDKTDYIWDDKGRLIQATVTTPSGTKIVTYKYNENNIRVSQTIGGVETKFLLDSNRDYAQVLEEYNNSGVQVSYVYGWDLISQNRGGQKSFYIYDGLGSVRALTNQTGNITDRYFYDAYGNLISASGTSTNNYRFTGEQLDSTTGDYYLRDRYYASDTGRFTRADRWEGVKTSPKQLHDYVYTESNPINFTDPTGKFSLAELNAAESIRLQVTRVYVEEGARFASSIFRNRGFDEAADYIDAFLFLSDTLDVYQSLTNILSSFNFSKLSITGSGGTGVPIPDPASVLAAMGARNRKHAKRHLSEFQVFDSSITAEKLYEIGSSIVDNKNQISNSNSSRKVYEAIVDIAGNKLPIRVALNERGALHSVHIRYD